MTASARLAELGLVLPPVATPAGVYLPAVRSGSLVFTAGQLPLVGGVVAATGKLGAEIDTSQGQQLAETCVLNALAAVHDLVGLDAVVRVVKVVGYVASVPGFTAQPAVLNGASELLGKIFGQAGTHARSAVGVAELPLGAPVEIELVVEV
ncbi:MAG: RidA family protein [Pseudonocardiales bacterium]|nr:RidA family protein [Pseudonocardiales bacterium]MBV9652867.1 RidA family protein [Pseudonocardiales bacterium]